jgi:hypothetical protein
LIGNDFDEKRAALVVEASLVGDSVPINIDVPHAPLRASSIAVRELEAIEYYPFGVN